MNANEIVSLPISSITPNTRFSRAMEAEKVEQISWSLETEGQLSPILVKRCDDGSLEVVSGHHRLAAAKLLGWNEIEAVVLEEELEKAVFYAANLFRSDLTPVDRAAAVIAYGETQNVKTNTELAELFGVTQPLISQLRSIHEHLEPEVKAFANEHRELTQVTLIKASRKQGAEAQMAVLNSFLQTLEKKKEKKEKSQPGYDQERMDKRLDTVGKTLENALDAMHEAGKTEEHKEALKALRNTLDETLEPEATVEELIDDLKVKMGRLDVFLANEENPGQYMNAVFALCDQIKEKFSPAQTQMDAAELPSEK